jgi:hypothetical protein
MSTVPSTLSTPIEYASELLDAISDAIGDTVGGPIERRYVSPGRPVFDCEQLTITLAGIGEADTVVGSSLAIGKRHTTGRVNLLHFLVTIVRDCVPTLDDNGNVPSVDEIEASADQVVQDVWAIWTYLYSAYRRGELLGGRCSELIMDGAVALETEGTFASFEVHFRVSIPGIVNAS